MMVVVAAAIVGGRRRRKRGRRSGGTRVCRRGDWEGGGEVMVNIYVVYSCAGLKRMGGKGEKKGGKGEVRKKN